ncbi:MAG: hypothetical protein ACRDZ1_00650 [Acidimicrobiia bacterium]
MRRGRSSAAPYSAFRTVPERTERRDRTTALRHVPNSHPEHDRFSGDELIAELERQGLVVGDRHVERFFGDFVIGVAERKE